MTQIPWNHEYLANVTSKKAPDTLYVFGETNSISCQGLAGVSDVYAAALWSVDYVLYTASLKIHKLYFHMGTPYRYSPWLAVVCNGTAKHVKPLYYGNLFTTTALAGGNKHVVSLMNETLFSAYGFYEAGVEGSQLKSVALVNLTMWNSTQEPSERSFVSWKLPEAFKNACVVRLTAPGVEVKTNITFAGQSVDDDGFFVGKRKSEAVLNGVVSVGAGKAVSVSL